MAEDITQKEAEKAKDGGGGMSLKFRNLVKRWKESEDWTPSAKKRPQVEEGIHLSDKTKGTVGCSGVCRP